MGLFIEWEYFNRVECHRPALYPDVHYKYRYSKVLDQWQYADIHCLGLNPPEYITTWYNIDFGEDKIRMKYVGGCWYLVDSTVLKAREVPEGIATTTDQVQRTANTPRHKPITMKKEQA